MIKVSVLKETGRQLHLLKTIFVVRRLFNNPFTLCPQTIIYIFSGLVEYLHILFYFNLNIMRQLNYLYLHSLIFNYYVYIFIWFCFMKRTSFFCLLSLSHLLLVWQEDLHAVFIDESQLFVVNLFEYLDVFFVALNEIDEISSVLLVEMLKYLDEFLQLFQWHRHEVPKEKLYPNRDNDITPDKGR